MKWKNWKFFLSRNALIHGSRHRAAMPWRQQSRTKQARGDRMTRQRAEDHQLYNRPTMTSWAHRGSLSKRRELVLSSLPTRPPCFCWFSAPVSNVACLISNSLYLLSTCMYHTFSHITFLGYNHMNSRASVLLDSLLSEHIIRYHMCPWGGGGGGGSFPVTTHGFSSRGVAAVRARRLFPSTISGVRGSVPDLPLGRKLDWQPVLSRAPKDPHLAVLAAAHSPF